MSQHSCQAYCGMLTRHMVSSVYEIRTCCRQLPECACSARLKAAVSCHVTLQKFLQSTVQVPDILSICPDAHCPCPCSIMAVRNTALNTRTKSVDRFSYSPCKRPMPLLLPKPGAMQWLLPKPGAMPLSLPVSVAHP